VRSLARQEGSLPRAAHRAAPLRRSRLLPTEIGNAGRSRHQRTEARKDSSVCSGRPKISDTSCGMSRRLTSASARSIFSIWFPRSIAALSAAWIASSARSHCRPETTAGRSSTTRHRRAVPASSANWSRTLRAPRRGAHGAGAAPLRSRHRRRCRPPRRTGRAVRGGLLRVPAVLSQPARPPAPRSARDRTALARVVAEHDRGGTGPDPPHGARRAARAPGAVGARADLAAARRPAGPPASRSGPISSTRMRWSRCSSTVRTSIRARRPPRSAR
jgi:hypothetical protein